MQRSRSRTVIVAMAAILWSYASTANATGDNNPPSFNEPLFKCLGECLGKFQEGFNACGKEFDDCVAQGQASCGTSLRSCLDQKSESNTLCTGACK